MPAQEIIGDKLLDDGSRYICTSNKYTGGFSDKIPISYSLSVNHKDGKDDKWYIVLEVQSMFPITIKPNAAFLLKTRNGETISINTHSGSSDRIGKYNTLSKMTIYRAYPSFEIEKEEIV